MVGEGGQIAKGVEQDKERLSRLPSFDGAQALEGPAIERVHGQRIKRLGGDGRDPSLLEHRMELPCEIVDCARAIGNDGSHRGRVQPASGPPALESQCHDDNGSP